MAAAVDQTHMLTTSLFSDLGVCAPLAAGLAELGFETPTPIQAAAIGPLLEGRDLVGQAQTGTGKTAAFGLPLLQHLDLGNNKVQGLILAPTRELALQVTEALRTYARHLGRVNILTVYGGAPLGPQLSRLRRGVHVVVGTPGRVIDCIERGALVLDDVRMAVLDEADEMLRMGFIEDVEHILAKTHPERQLALFSATMPGAIKRIAEATLSAPLTISLKAGERNVDNIEQRVLFVNERDKLEALVRVLEADGSGATLVFARTQIRCAQLAEDLQARGLGAAPLHGGMSQSQREDVVRRMREERIQLVVATDVAARGLDVNSITHVVNFDPPEGPEVYLHRIGRTGRAGRQGVAISLLTPRDRRVKAGIERYTKRKLVIMEVPTNAELQRGRERAFEAAIRLTLQDTDLAPYRAIIEKIAADGDSDLTDIAAAVSFLASQHRPLLVTGRGPRSLRERPERAVRERSGAGSSDRPARQGSGPQQSGEWARMFLSIGSAAGLRPGDLVGAVANELGISGRAIGKIDIRERFSFFEVAAEYADRVIEAMAETKLRGRRVAVRPARPAPAAPPQGRHHDGAARKGVENEGPPPRKGKGKTGLARTRKSDEAPRAGAEAKRQPLPHKRKPGKKAKKRHRR